MNSRLTKLEKTWAEVRHSDNNGCLEAMGQAVGVEEYTEMHSLNAKLCLTKYNPGIACHTECIFSCVDYDVDLMSKVLRTLPTE